VYYDFLSGKEIKAERFEIPKAERENFVFNTFQNGDVYAIANSMLLYKLDKQSMSLKPVTTLDKEHAELSAGIADFDFINDSYGDGMKLLTNDGKNYSYYPIANVVYDQDQVRQNVHLKLKIPRLKPEHLLTLAYPIQVFLMKKFSFISGRKKII
jgi:hypothetical protein